ncbi:hypothetical protein [Streptomyces sp. NBC_01465]|uniref:hypothetical protein n=1 Tax=Streptomyces sp. NBC_01465 TaxID=2903878 RepID=UPI002E366D8E|nr:hypothetical protein [Streptomyces sp. NBC_01465]
MIFRRGAGFAGAVADFEKAVRARDNRTAERASMALGKAFARAKDDALREGGVRLAGLLPEVPHGPRAMIAVLVGACVERGADAQQCAPAVFAELRQSLLSAGEFTDRWAATGGGDIPDPGEDVDAEVVERVGHEPAAAWTMLPQWEMAAVAMLNVPAVRTGLGAGPREELLGLLGRVAEASGEEFKCLAYALTVLDDEPLVVLHRESRTGYALRMTGIGDTFQLHTLLAGVLAGGGHVPGYAPSAKEVAVCRDAPGQVPTTGSFDLMAPDGTRLWNEGTPADIPLVEGHRLLVLDPPPYARSWPAGRFFPGMRGDLVLERVLDAEQTEGWFAHVSDVPQS